MLRHSLPRTATLSTSFTYQSGSLTLSYLMRMLESRNPASLEVCALLTKPDRREIDVRVRYTGFEIPNEFVIGYGLDFGERYRNLPYVAVLDPDAVP